MFHKVALCLLLAALAACTKGGVDKNSAQGTLSEYISRSFALKTLEDKPKLLDLTTGEVKTALQNLDIEGFRRHFIDSKREFIALKIRDERKVGADRISITYELTYVNKGVDSQAKITNKKNALFQNEGGKWLISEVRNLKTFIEHQNEMSF